MPPLAGDLRRNLRFRAGVVVMPGVTTETIDWDPKPLTRRHPAVPVIELTDPLIAELDLVGPRLKQIFLANTTCEGHPREFSLWSFGKTSVKSTGQESWYRGFWSFHDNSSERIVRPTGGSRCRLRPPSTPSAPAVLRY